MLGKEPGGALDNLKRRYERKQDATRIKIETWTIIYQGPSSIYIYDQTVAFQSF